MKKLTRADQDALQVLPMGEWIRPADFVGQIHDPFKRCQRLYQAGKLERRSVVTFGGNDHEYKRVKQS